MSRVTHRPDAAEYAPYYGGYVALVEGDDALAAMRAQEADLVAFLRAVPEAVGDVRHAPYTWSVKEVVGHITDAERIFSCRALRFGRADATPLPGFDENGYVRGGEFDRCALQDLVAGFEAARRSSVMLFQTLPDAAWLRVGEANGNLVSVRALAYILIGHAQHHGAILRKRLGV
jgi:hypothetical protein